MPTVATRPSLEATQAVGALLLHQFARERFQEAGIDESLIREAEDREHLDALASTLLHEDGQMEGNDTTNCSASSHNETPNTSFQTSANNTTVRSDGQHDGPSELFHSVAESSVNEGTPHRADRTIYHSMNVSDSRPALAESPFERLQASPCLASYGRELRRIAEEFEKSRLRENVKERARQVNLHDITKESFVQLLEELFQGKITRERIVILFFFCTDVALRAALSAQELVVKLLGWSFSYIVNTVCSFVYKLGGWDKVLFYNFIFYQLPSIMITCCALMGMLWFGMNIRRSLRD